MGDLAWLLLFLLGAAFAGGGKKPKDGPLGPLLTGELDVPEQPTDQPDAPSIATLLGELIKPVPTVGFGYRIKFGENLYGTDGIIARALLPALGRMPSAQERMDYYRAICRVRSNWRLYGTIAVDTTPSVERVDIQNPDGVVVVGTMTAASCPWHDSWGAAAIAGVLPSRLIMWTRKQGGGKCNLRPLGDWEAKLHGGSRVSGTLFLPPVSAMVAGLGVSASAAFDWPPELYAAVGTTWEAWTP